MAPRSEQELATALATAVENSAAGGMRDLQATLDGLHRLLWGAGSDGIVDLFVAQSGPTRITLLGCVIWVETQKHGPLEAEFCIDESEGRVTAFTVRAGDARDDAPAYWGSARKLLRALESRPTADEDWEHVRRYEFG